MSNILHISDLHFRAPSEQDKNIFYSNKDFCKEFVRYIKEKIGKIEYLIFTGDAINRGYVKAFNDAKKFLDEIISELGIDRRCVLLCMGNHDFNRNELLNEALEIPYDAQNKQESLKRIQSSDAKYKYFKSFVNEVCGRDLNVNDAIYDAIIDAKNKFIIIGVNTCYKESYDEASHKGEIDKNQFVYKLTELLKDKSDYKVFLAMHHNPDPNAVGNEIYNWKEILLDVQKEHIKNPIVVFSGHIHYIETSLDENSINGYGQDGDSAAVKGKGKGTYYFSAGSLLNTEYKSRSFNLYEIDNNTITYHFHTQIDAEEKPEWREFKEDSITIEEQDFASNKVQDPNEDKDKKIIPGENKQIEDKLNIMKYIGKHELYYSGHFHWNTDENTKKSDFKSHGYIDINYLVSHNESLEIITRLFRAEIDEIINMEKDKLGKTLLVAIGMECNVIGARLSIMFPDFDFSYLTRKYKAKDYNIVENGTRLAYGGYDTIILIKDIMVKTSKGDTVEIIRDKFYGKNVHLISLFYCGESKEDVYKSINKVQFHPLIEDIKIPICNVQDEKKCPIVEYKLQTIYKC